MKTYLIAHIEVTDPDLMAQYREKVPKIVEKYNGKFLVRGGDSKIIEGKESTLFSLIAMPEARVSVSGARWNLQHEKLKMGGRGIHNEIGPTGITTIDCHSGNLLLIQGNFVLPHD